MAIKVLRYQQQGQVHWGIVDGRGVRPLSTPFATTRELIEAGLPELRKLAQEDGGAFLSEASLRPLSPITENQQLICQATNYDSHRREAGLESGSPGPNVFFRKASSSICGAHDDVRKPERVKLLDYEVELGLVVGRSITEPIRNADQLADYLVGVVIVNDVSARDIQVPEGQYFKGKSFRTFCPLGPYLVLLEAAELQRLDQLRLTLSVNGETRQDALAGEMIHRPPATLSELSQVMDMFPGDVIATGTPAGVALQAPKQPVRWLAQTLPESVKWRLFLKGQLRSDRYLKVGDLIEARIRDRQGDIDLGMQQNRVVAG